MAEVNNAGKYNYMDPEEKKIYKSKVDPAGPEDNFYVTAISLTEVFKDKDMDAKPTKNNSKLKDTNAIKKDIVLSTMLTEEMQIEVKDNKEDKSININQREKE